MDFRSILETFYECINWITGWRFSVCLLAGIVLALLAAGFITAEPLRWIVAGTIVAIAAYLGWQWDNSH